jgi:hypothetical protein
MRPFFVTLITSTMLVAALFAVRADAKAGTTCAPTGAHVVAHNSRAAVFTRASTGGLDYYGCARGHQAKRFAVGPAPEDTWAEDFVSHVRLRGTTVRWTVTHEPGQSCRYGTTCAAPTRVNRSLHLG